MSIKIKFTGVAKLIKEIERRERLMWTTIMDVIDKYVDLMVADAKANAPKDLGTLGDSIKKEVVDDRTRSYVMTAVHGAMQEFGTGIKVEVPDELADQALAFKGYKSGNFYEFVQNIKEWCERKGIDPNAAYPIAVSILDEGLTPRPFYYPAYTKYKDKMLQEIEEKLQELFNI